MKTTVKPIVVPFLLLTSTLIFAQNPGDPPVDPGVSPINDYLIPMLLIGVAFGYHLLKKKTQEV
jgi:hypothetical protein